MISIKRTVLATVSLGAMLALSSLTTSQTAFAQGAQQAPANSLAKADKEDMAPVLQKLEQLGAKPIGTLSVEETRRGPTPADAVKALLKDQGKLPPTLGVQARDIAIPGAAGEIPARIYTPEGQGPFPVVVYYHGGGWVIADLDTYDSSARGLADGAKAIVVSSHYRQAPEHKFPAAHEDAFTAYKWVLENAQTFNGDPKRVAVAGESAGGNLAANVAIMARDQNVAKPAHMLLVYPVAGVDLNTSSYQEHANAKPLSRAGMQWFFTNATKGDEDKQNPMLDILGKAKLNDLPPATVITAEIDPLLSEGKMLADKLNAAGVKTEYQTHSGVTHEFFGMAAVVDDAKRAQAFASERLAQALSSNGTATGSTPPKK